MFDFSSMIYTVPALLIAITIHEYAHALTADAMGVPMPLRQMPWVTLRRVILGV